MEKKKRTSTEMRPIREKKFLAGGAAESAPTVPLRVQKEDPTIRGRKREAKGRLEEGEQLPKGRR